MRGSCQFDFQRTDPTQPVSQSGLIWTRHVGIGNDGDITGQLFLPRPQNTLEVVTAHLLLPLNQKDDIGLGSTRLDLFGHPHHVGKNLPLIVRRSPCHHHPIDQSGLERISRPPISHFGRLHIVVAINQNSSPLGRATFFPFRQHHRRTGGGHNFWLHPHFPKLARQPSRTLSHDLSTGGVGRDRGKTEEIVVVRLV